MRRTRTKKASASPKAAPELAFGQHLRRLRQKSGLSQERLAAAAGMSRETIRTYETGQRTPNYTLLKRLARGLRLHPRDVIPRQDAA